MGEMGENLAGAGALMGGASALVGAFAAPGIAADQASKQLQATRDTNFSQVQMVEKQTHADIRSSDNGLLAMYGQSFANVMAIFGHESESFMNAAANLDEIRDRDSTQIALEDIRARTEGKQLHADERKEHDDYKVALQDQDTRRQEAKYGAIGSAMR